MADAIQDILDGVDKIEQNPAVAPQKTPEEIAAEQAATDNKAQEEATQKAEAELLQTRLQQEKEADKEGIIDVPQDKRKEYNPFAAARDWKRKFTQQEAETRRLADEKAALEAQLRKLATPEKEEAPKAPTFDDDPANFLKLQTEETRKTTEQIQAELSALRTQQEVGQQVTAFKQVHADYDEALTHLVEREMNAWERAGGMNMLRKQFLANNRSGVEEYARQHSLTLDDAATQIAKGTIFQARQAQVVAIAKSEGKPIPEVVYELSQAYGYQPKQEQNQQQQPSQEEALKREREAKERVERAKAQSALEGSVNMANQSNPAPVEILSKKDYMEMQARMSPLELAQFVMAQEISDPLWYQKLT